MRIISAHVQNFGSYKGLTFDFQNQGLTLIQGPTGSGKSTLCDIIPWILFGHTAKGGKVDEIRSWNSEGSTTGTIRLANGYTISRSRNPNDLYFCINDAEVRRGKDLGDTQKQINSLLGLDCELYLSGAYFHEFSQTAQFFTTTAKNRRQICEQIVDLSLAKKLQLNVSPRYKTLRDELNKIVSQQTTLEYNVKSLENINKQESTRANNWTNEHEKTIKYIKACYDKFEATRDYTITGKCNECGTQLKEDKHVHNNKENPHLASLEKALKEVNPHTNAAKDYTHAISKQKEELKTLETNRIDLAIKLSDLDVLQDVIESFRGSLITNTVSYLESQANKLLNDYFDAEIRVEFSVTEADKLEVIIYKDGNLATFTQLSKGQRQLLKLCFATAVMQSVENHNGIHFSQIFYDEALDGLDENFKAKAYRLLDNLATTHESVFVVEHSEGLKAMFPSSHSVSLVKGNSQICQN